MKDGNHVHNEDNPQGLHKHKNLIIFGVVAILIAIAAYDLGQKATETANINNVFEMVVNNTNLAPQIHPGVPGTGERVSGTKYYTNSSPIQIFVWAHADTSGQDAEIHLSINDTIVADISGKPLAVAEQNNKSIVAIIPKGANYTVDFFNFHHYEWREYQILSGKNGTLSINQSITNITNTTVSDAQLNTKVNKTGDRMTGLLNNTFGINTTYLNISNSIGIGTLPLGPLHIVRNDGLQGILQDGYGLSNIPTIIGRTARGTLTSPTSSMKGDRSFIMGGGGYDTNGFTGSTSIITFYTEENFNTSNHGSGIRFETTPGGSTVRRVAGNFSGNGTFNVFGNGTFDTIFSNKITKNDTSVNTTILIEGNIKTTGELRFFNSPENCQIVLNSEILLTCTNPINPDQGTILTIGNEIFGLDYVDATNTTHMELNTNGITIFCGTTDAPENTGVACIR